MGYYEVLEEIERLHKAGINKIKSKDVADNLGLCVQGVSRSLSELVSEGVITRVVISDKRREVYYKVRKGGEQEGFINGVFKVIVNIIR